ncbi:hypothetical protein J7E83_03705 [Arthrobacter sp. ISL-48]|uniref:cupin domain-containing protein n=1 Tax=Arthrobacter sp. ISL-48 TaxID=2819110 RepID=UPI001BE9163B|nr:cupin domain-containing protein [Arthrobacter sp. ISL-48]MBT2531243.1 hypothetical protein [Arthrobacter sp. ISL-48]
MNTQITSLVGDMADFQANYFNKKPLFRKNVLPNVAEDVLSLEDMDNLLNLEVVRFPYIKVNLNGTGVPEPGYTKDIKVQGQTVSGVVDPEKLHSLYRAGGTITWASVNQIVPKVRDFTREINRAMRVRTDAVAFLTPAEKKGYPVHHDGVDLFIIQLSGSKKWRLWNIADERRGESASYSEAQLGAPVIEESLKPGDVLYLPYGTPHATEAEGEPSLHLSVMMRPRMWNDLLQESVTRILDQSKFDEYPPLSEESSEAAFQKMTELVEELSSQLRSMDIGEEWERYRESGKKLPGSSTSSVFADSHRIAQLSHATAVVRTNTPYETTQLEDGRVQVLIAGLKFAVSKELGGRLDGIAAGETTSLEKLMPGSDEERGTKMARSLVRAGIFEEAKGA